MMNTTTNSSGGGRGHNSYHNQNRSKQQGNNARNNSNNNKSNNKQTKQQQQNPMSGVPYGHLPAFLPGSASLVEQLDRKVMIVLRDGRHLVGVLRSFDQFSNMVLENTTERRIQHVVKKTIGEEEDQQQQPGSTLGASDNTVTICYYTDIQLGLYLVRGDSMVLLGEVHEEEEDNGEDNENEKEQEKEVPSSSLSPQEALTGSGLLMGIGDDGMTTMNSIQKQTRKTHMKKVSLEVFEKLQAKLKEAKEKGEEGEDGVELVESLTWEFDMDLVI
jgi:U6 snRNA-associated Sm-like protein LSm1